MKETIKYILVTLLIAAIYSAALYAFSDDEFRELMQRVKNGA